MLGVVPAFFGVRAWARDPVFGLLDELAVPGWAATSSEDQVSGNLFCLVDCRFRERTVESQRGWEETAQVYERALADQGWRPWQVTPCPEQPVEGRYSCWRRDELTLDLWVRERPCLTDPGVVPPEDAVPPDVDGEPGSEPDDVPAECAGSVVSLKVRNAIDDERTRPQPDTGPSLTGETPDPVFTDDPLSPSPS